MPRHGDEDLEDGEFLPMYEEVEPLWQARKSRSRSYDWNDGEWMELWSRRAADAGIDIVDSVIAKDYPDAEGNG